MRPTGNDFGFSCSEDKQTLAWNRLIPGYGWHNVDLD